MTSPQAIGIPVRHVLSLALVAGYVDALGFFDLNEIYTAAMTGNTVQLGVTFVREQWPHLAVAGATLGAFFCGGLFSSFIRRRLPHPAILLLIMAPLLLGSAGCPFGRTESGSDRTALAGNGYGHAGPNRFALCRGTHSDDRGHQ